MAIIICDYCDGTGKLDVELALYLEGFDCTNCDATGFVDEEEEK